MNQGFQKYGSLPDMAAEADTGGTAAPVTGIIIVGTVSAYRKFRPENSASEYRKYARAFESWGIDREPHLSAEEFSQSISGWTNIKVFGVPLLFAGYAKALVSSEAAAVVDFEPAIATFLVQSSSDLVAARTNSDGALVVEALLCKDDWPNFSECARRYEKGCFDAETGRRLKGKLGLASDGPRIDPETFLLIDPATEQARTHGDETGEEG